MKLRDLAAALDARLVGDGALEVERPVHPADAVAPTDLALAMEADARQALADSPARIAIVAEAGEEGLSALDAYLVVKRSRYAMAGLMDAFACPVHAERGVHPTAVVADDAEIGDDVSIGAFAYVGPRARVGAGTIVMAHVTVGAAATIGECCLFHPGVRVGERVSIGNRVIIQHNASIGADGFSYVTPQAGSVESVKATGRVEATNTDIRRINSVGTVILEDDVEIGAGAAIDRGTVAATVVKRNTKIDNLVMVGHNCVIGENCFICAQVGIAGSTTIGDRVVMAGQVGVADHVMVGSDSVIAAQAGVAGNVEPRSVLFGTPAVNKRRAMEQAVYMGRLKSMAGELRRLRERVVDLEARETR